jgi:Protein of unknown function (DUF3124)
MRNARLASPARHEPWMATKLSLRNTSPAHDPVVRRIHYHDTAGRLLRRLVDGPHAIPPLATAAFRIDRDDPSDGSGPTTSWNGPSRPAGANPWSRR